MSLKSVITIFNDVDVTLLDAIGGDNSIASAARVSLLGVEDLNRNKGLIKVLMEKKHGSPFEHNLLKFHVRAPIFVFREFMRHRIGFSYNEISGRYIKLLPEFYVPSSIRPLVNQGTSMNPNYTSGSADQFSYMETVLIESYQRAWDDYENLIDNNVANEVARAVLPVGIMSQMIVTCNVRSLLNFLSLRTNDERARYISHPQYEIELVARKMEAHLAELYPLTYEAFNNTGRVGP